MGLYGDGIDVRQGDVRDAMQLARGRPDSVLGPETPGRTSDESREILGALGFPAEYMHMPY